MVNRKSLLSSAEVMPVAATATAMLDSEIILPTTPAAEFTDAVNTGFTVTSVAAGLGGSTAVNAWGEQR